MTRVPTEKQYRYLLRLGNGCALVVGRRRETTMYLRRGWVTAEDHSDHFAWVRITPDGLRALALAVETFGLPAMTPKAATA